MRKLLALFSMLLLAVVASPRESHALVLNVDGGWQVDSLSLPGDPTSGSPITFTLASSGVFTLLDCCNIGDIWTISGDFSGVSTFVAPAFSIPLGIGDAFIGSFFDPIFADTNWSRFQILLGAGTYTLSLTGDGAGGLPADVGLRVDASPVPLPGAAVLLLSGLGALGGMSLRRRKPA